MSGAPDHWHAEKLGEVLSAIEAGKNFRCIEKPPDDGRPGVVKVSAVTWGTFDELESKTCPDPRLFNERYLIRPGDFLISRANTLELVGACVVVGAVSRRLMLSDKILRLVMPDDLKRWVLWFLRSKAGRSQIEAKASGNQLSMRNIGQDGIRGIELPLAPPDERQHIVAAIDSHFSRLDAATATLERVHRNLERYRASVLKAAVEGRLVPTEAELAKKEGRSYEPASVLLKRILAERRRRWEEAELAKLKAKGKAPTDDRWKDRYEEPAAPDTDGLPELPEGWCWASVGQLISRPLANGRSVPTATDGFPVLRLTAIRSGRVLLSERKGGSWTRDDAKEWLVAEGDFLVVRGNGSRDLVGRGGLVTTTPDPVAFPDTLIRVRIDAQHFEPRLLRLFWDSQVVRDFLQRTAKTTAGIYKINQGDLEKLPLPLPPYEEQARLAGEIERLDSVATVEASRVEATLVHIARLRQSILKWAFEGRLVRSAGEHPLVDAALAGRR
jgi:type I restriction enzyme S subunit